MQILSTLLLNLQTCNTANMQNTQTPLTSHHETYVVVDYNFGNGFADRRFKGWVRISEHDSNRVVARHFRGRVTFQLCKLSDILSISEVNTPKKRKVNS